MNCCGVKDKQMAKEYKKENSKKQIKSTKEFKFQSDQIVEELMLIEEEAINQQKNRINRKYMYPASFRKAQFHLRGAKFGYNADKIGAEEGLGPSGFNTIDTNSQVYEKPKVCPCCNQRINTKNIKLCYSTTNPESAQHPFLLTASSSLFFSFIKMAIVYSVIMFMICGIFNLLTSIDGTYCIRNPKICTKSVFELISTYNKHKDPKQRIMLQIQNILCLIAVIGSIVFFTFYKKNMYQIYNKIDGEHQTQDDYTLFVENIPILDFSSAQNSHQMSLINFNYEQKIKQIFEKELNDWINWMQGQQHLDGQIEKNLIQVLKSKNKTIDDLEYENKVTSISLCFNLTEVERISQQRQILMQKHMSNYQSPNGNYTGKLEIQNQIKALNDIQVSLCQEFAKNNTPTFNISHFVGKAFVSFEYEHFKEYIMQKYEDPDRDYYYYDNKLIVSRASHPTDINWQNMKISDSDRFTRIVTSYLIIAMILVFSAAALIGIDFLKLKGIKEGQELSPQTTILNYSLNIFSSVVTTVINSGIWYIISGLTDFEKHKTLTNKIASLIIKAIIAQFINTVLILYLIQVFNQRPYLSTAGLVVQVSTYIIVSGFISIVTNAVNIHLWIRYATLWWKYGYITQKGMLQKESIPTYQVKLNRDYELPAFDITARYVKYLLQIYTCMFYCYLVPVGLLATAVMFGIQYWIDKAKLFKLSSEYKELGYFLSKAIFKVFEGSLLVFTVGNLIFATAIYGDYHIDLINIISLGIAFVYTCFIIFAPLSLERKVFGRYEIFESMSYTECLRCQKFDETYWTQNLATVFAKQQDLNNKGKYVAQQIVLDFFGDQDLQTDEDPYDYAIEDKINV